MDNETFCHKCGSLRLKTEEIMFSNNTKHIKASCADCGAYIKFLPQDHFDENPGDFVMPFGKHKGEQIKNLSPDYLHWLSENIKSKSIKRRVDKFLNFAHQPNSKRMGEL